MEATDALTPGMEVFTSDGTGLGQVKRIWWPDGRVQPPEQDKQEGTFSIENVGRTAASMPGYIAIARPLAPDWYVGLDRVRNTAEGRVTLNLSYAEAQRLPLQEKPA